MGLSEIITQIDREIAQLQRARALLSGSNAAAYRNVAVAAGKPAKEKKAKRNLTPEGRKRISEAVKRRWAEQKKATGSR